MTKATEVSEELAQLDLAGLLYLLEPVPEPPLVSLWPQTAAWLWLGAAALVAAGWVARWLLARRRANAYRRAALREIAAAGEAPAALAAILRRTALAAFPREEVASLHGEAWLAFLDRTGGGTAFREGPGRVFARAAYVLRAEEPAAGAERLAAVAARWVHLHRADRETST